MKRFSFNLNSKEISLSLPLLSIKVPTWVVMLLTIAASIVAYVISYKLNYVVAYNDARAHMNMARLVIDNLNPGLAQIGSVWLPLDHLLKLLLVWNDTLWQSGFAGSIWSMLAYVGTTYYIFVFIRDATKNQLAAFLGTLVFIANINVLYLQTTPMTELLLLLFFTAASYYLYLWAVGRKTLYLIASAFMVFLASLTRYDGWFLFGYICGTVALISFQELWMAKQGFFRQRWTKIRHLLESRLIIFGSFAGFGIALWLIWNKLIFGSALYFALGPYSAHAQQERIDAAGSLLTKFNALLSLKAYWWAMVDNMGFLIIIFSIFGLIIYIIQNRTRSNALAVYSLLTPLFFHIISLILGFSILVVPELGHAFTTEAKASWFNVRYGLMIAPAVAFFSGYLVRKSVLLKMVLVVLIITYAAVFLVHKDIITLTDGVFGTSSLDVGEARDWLTTNAKNGDGLVLTSIAFNNALAFSTGMDLKRFIHEGTGHYWTESLNYPQKYAQWIVMANGDVGDQVYESLVQKHSNDFLRYYDLKVRGKHTNIYQRKEFPQGLVLRDGNGFVVDGKPFSFVGVNSYDLAFRTHEEIDRTLETASQNGIRVVRLWAFSEGFADGFQPEPGVYNERQLDNLAYIVHAARQNDQKLIITLANYWEDYGGVPQYLKWVGLPGATQADRDAFFTNQRTKDLYKNYVTKVLTYKNQYNNFELRNDTAIMAWEVMNEPRSSAIENGEIVTKWVDEMAGHIRQLDDNHLISPGTEGFSKLYNDGDNGPLLSEVASLQATEFTTTHFYLQDQPRDEEGIFDDWSTTTQQNLNKPLVIGELGLQKNPRLNNNRSREDILKNLLALAKQRDVDGVILWNWALKLDDSFGISPDDPGDKELLKIIKSYSDSVR